MAFHKDLLKNMIPSTQEALFAIIVVSFVVNFAFAYMDVVVHDNYTLLITGNCYAENMSEFCINARELHECTDAVDSQRCLGMRYWVMLPQLVFALALFLAIARMFFGLIAGAERNAMILVIGGAWFLSAIMLPYFGWGDWAYYVILDRPMDDLLPWLNDSGFLEHTKLILGSDPVNVESIDLYFTMGIGLGLLIGMWTILTHLNRKELLEWLK